MVYSISARDDLVSEILIKDIKYIRKKNSDSDLASDEPNLINVNPYEEYMIKAQCSVQGSNSRYISEGILVSGDLIGVFAYKYERDINDEEIYPILIPSIFDEIEYLGQKYVIKSCIPLTSEDKGIIGWEFTAIQSGNNTFLLDNENNINDN